MENNTNPNLQFDEEKLAILVENKDKLNLILTEEQKVELIGALKADLAKIEDAIKILKEQNENQEGNIRDDDHNGSSDRDLGSQND
jgi:hypothetical protein